MHAKGLKGSCIIKHTIHQTYDASQGLLFVATVFLPVTIKKSYSPLGNHLNTILPVTGS